MSRVGIANYRDALCEGVSIRLVPGLFDPENPEHLKSQKQAMKYFKLL
jgi:hypothetical protein